MSDVKDRLRKWSQRHALPQSGCRKSEEGCINVTKILDKIGNNRYEYSSEKYRKLLLEHMKGILETEPRSCFVDTVRRAQHT